jgi:hypothetical protein
MHKASLRLFNAIQVDRPNHAGISQDTTLHTIRQGYVLDPAITPNRKLLALIDSVIGLSGKQANSAFHKSWLTIKSTSTETLVEQQILHYLSTYGAESYGLFDQAEVYIPHETLQLPEIAEDIPLKIIKATDAEALLQAILQIGNGIALAPETIADIMTIVASNQYDSAFIEEINNHELKCALCSHYGLVPEEPIEYLRYVVTELTGESLLIKNRALIDKIKAGDGKKLDRFLSQAPANLATIFYRYKPLLLALKSISSNKSFFNKLRRNAPSQHRPFVEDYLNNVTNRIKRGTLNPDDLHHTLEKANFWRKDRLAYALNHRLNAGNSIIYRIRNGKGWATGFKWPDDLTETTLAAFGVVFDSMANDIKPAIENKTVYIPGNIEYAVPASEKQFSGFLPSGTSITAPENLIVGVHWFNALDARVDLDLSLIGKSGKMGWDGNYRSSKKGILFSGDVTDAPPPDGASELFYIAGGLPENQLLMLNYFNFRRGKPVNTKILVANEPTDKLDHNHLVDPNNIVMTSSIEVSKKQNVIGLIATKDEKIRIYFLNVSIGTSVTASGEPYIANARRYLFSSQIESISLAGLLEKAGAIVTRKKSGAEDFDLSPERLSKTSIISLLTDPMGKNQSNPISSPV